jgi:hypothetical protein
LNLLLPHTLLPVRCVQGHDLAGSAAVLTAGPARGLDGPAAPRRVRAGRSLNVVDRCFTDCSQSVAKVLGPPVQVSLGPTTTSAASLTARTKANLSNPRRNQRLIAPPVRVQRRPRLPDSVRQCQTTFGPGRPLWDSVAFSGRRPLERLIQTAQQVTVTQHRLDPLGAELVPAQRARREPLLEVHRRQ